MRHPLALTALRLSVVGFALFMLGGCHSSANIGDLTFDQLSAHVATADKVASVKLAEFNTNGGEKNPYTLADYEHRFLRGNAAGFQVIDVIYSLKADAVSKHPIHEGFPNDFTVVINESTGDTTVDKVAAKK